MENKEKNDLLSVKEAATLLGVHQFTLHGWIKKDQESKKNNIETQKNFKCPPYGRIGNRYRFRREDIEKFLKEAMGEN
jgi:hypothetical protein